MRGVVVDGDCWSPIVLFFFRDTKILAARAAAMSRAAEEYVKACTHPQVKRGVRDLFEAIAHFVPEGETTTPPIGMKTLAAKAQMHRVTGVSRLEILVEIGEVNVIGEQGQTARYQIVHLDGVRPIVAASLPLRADLQPVRPRPPRPESDTLDLFDPPASYDQTAYNLSRSATSWSAQLVAIGYKLVRVLVAIGYKLRKSATRWRSNDDQLVAIGYKLTASTDTDLISARDVLLLKETTTTTAAESPPGPRAAKPPPCPALGRVHAWCGSDHASARQHVPRAFHREERRKLARRPGETDAELDARLFARYDAILAAIPDTEPILDKDEFAFWKRVMRAAPGSTARAPTPRSRAAQEPSADLFAKAREERRQRWGGRES